MTPLPVSNFLRNAVRQVHRAAATAAYRSDMIWLESTVQPGKCWVSFVYVSATEEWPVLWLLWRWALVRYTGVCDARLWQKINPCVVASKISSFTAETWENLFDWCPWNRMANGLWKSEFRGAAAETAAVAVAPPSFAQNYNRATRNDAADISDRCDTWSIPVLRGDHFGVISVNWLGHFNCKHWLPGNIAANGKQGNETPSLVDELWSILWLVFSVRSGCYCDYGSGRLWLAALYPIGNYFGIQYRFHVLFTIEDYKIRLSSSLGFHEKRNQPALNDPLKCAFQQPLVYPIEQTNSALNQLFAIGTRLLVLYWLCAISSWRARRQPELTTFRRIGTKN